MFAKMDFENIIIIVVRAGGLTVVSAILTATLGPPLISNEQSTAHRKGVATPSTYNTTHHPGANQPQHDPSLSNNPPCPGHTRYCGGVASSTSIFVAGSVSGDAFVVIGSGAV
jgi:hypothetical protein